MLGLRKLHRYVSLAVSLQLLLWTISGIYFSFNKIEDVRGEQYFKTEEVEEGATPINIKKVSKEFAFNVIGEETLLIPLRMEIIEEAKAGSEYRGRDLPLYKVIAENEKGEEINIYQNPYTGEILAIRSQQWRIWDLMWGLHIMDWNNRDNIGNIFLKIFSFIALFTAATGVILFFKRK